MPERRPDSTRAYRVLASLLPRWYRDRYGAELLQLHADRLGRDRGVRFWLAVARDVMLTSIQLRWDRASAGAGAAPRRAGAFDIVRLALVMAIRGLRQSPAFTVAVALMLALGIGANAAIFTVLDRLLLDPPEHIVQAQQVKRVYVHGLSAFSGRIDFTSALSYPDYRALRDVSGFASVAAYSAIRLTLDADAASERVRVEMATASYFPLLGVKPARGRLYGEGDDQIDAAEPVAVVSDGFWRRRLGAATNVVGRRLALGRGTYTIVGVAPRGFTGVDLAPVDVWLPLHTAYGIQSGRDWVDARGWYWLGAVVRLRPGLPEASIAAQASVVHRGVRANEKKPDRASQIVLAPVLAALGPNPTRETVVAKLLGAVALMVLLIACANVANLFLARGVQRRKQFAVQSALGLGRGRLVAQVFCEAVLIALLAGLAAFVVSSIVAPALFHFLIPAGELPSTGSGRAMLMTVLLTLAASLLAGLVPAMRSSKVDVLDVLRSGRSSLRSSWLRRSLLGLQAALSVILLVGAGLFIRSLEQAQHRDLGVDLATVTIDFELTRGASERQVEEVTYAALERLRQHPLVESAAIASLAPFNGFWGLSVDAPRPDSVPRGANGAMFVAGTSDYFKTIGIPLLRGRVLTDADDRPNAPPVAVVNQAMATAVWKTRNAIGQCLLLGNPKEKPPCTTVVGVVADVLVKLTATGPQMAYYVAPHHKAIGTVPANTILVRTRGDSRAALPALRAAARVAVPGGGIRYVDVGLVGDALDRDLRSWRLGATLLTVFGVLALLVAAAGLYSVLAFDVVQRRFELGLRSALGAGASRLVQTIVGRSLGVAAGGVAVGLVAALWLARAAEDLLFQTAPTTPAIYVSAVAVLMTVAVSAALVPAWRATRVDPKIAMREE